MKWQENSQNETKDAWRCVLISLRIQTIVLFLKKFMKKRLQIKVLEKNLTIYTKSHFLKLHPVQHTFTPQ